jgi:hypothetical protein
MIDPFVLGVLVIVFGGIFLYQNRGLLLTKLPPRKPKKSPSDKKDNPSRPMPVVGKKTDLAKNSDNSHKAINCRANFDCPVNIVCENRFYKKNNKSWGGYFSPQQNSYSYYVVSDSIHFVPNYERQGKGNNKYHPLENLENIITCNAITFTHKAPPFITAIIGKLKRNSNQNQFVCKECLDSLEYPQRARFVHE